MLFRLGRSFPASQWTGMIPTTIREDRTQANTSLLEVCGGLTVPSSLIRPWCRDSWSNTTLDVSVGLRCNSFIRIWEGGPGFNLQHRINYAWCRMPVIPVLQTRWHTPVRGRRTEGSRSSLATQEVDPVKWISPPKSLSSDSTCPAETGHWGQEQSLSKWINQIRTFQEESWRTGPDLSVYFLSCF